ncbi:EamA family transporter [Allosaccharopolyspora coralli]|uniref:EamA family transporter n=1 Tax=Allosaccharopolyspora coralli TaxID=2665642 RepID=A0A5Q3Q835_9PSEU|nr:EamA family transporter [Allosaccharopolyspora coralli]QGK70718.1 EamA family transporter [Allosaccharopolyspora coralli]
MPTTTAATSTRPASDTAGSRWAGTGVMAASGLSNQTGAAIGALAFPVLGPAGVVAARQYVAAIVLLALARPRWRRFTWTQWWPVVLLGTAFGAMNLFLYGAIDRIGLGLAVTLEFLGPLAIALAGSRRRTDLACAALAVAGVVVLTRPQPTTDYTGIALALLAAACWASYILLNRTVGRRLPGTEGSATGAAVSALLFTPVGVHSLTVGPLDATALMCAATAGLLSSAVPLVADLFALRRVPTHFFGLFMSANPVFAAVLGLLVLDQSLGWAESAAIVAIVAANAISILTSRPPGDTTPPRHVPQDELCGSEFRR